VTTTNKQRLLRNSVVWLLISFVLIGCGIATTTADNAKELEANHYPNTPDNSQEIKNENRYAIIEIWEELDGSVPIRGKSLYFRLYDEGMVEFDYVLRKRTYTDGTVEFEYEPRKEPILPPRHTKSVESSLERTPPTKISEEEFRKFKSLLEYLTKSKDIKQEYKPVASTLDVITKLTILLKENDTTERKIIINDADYDVTSSKYEKKFPNLLVNLIKEVQLVRAKLQEEKKDQNL
jgi:hypothetical protein